MRAKEAAQPVAAIAADEPSEAESAASELASSGGREAAGGARTRPKGVRSAGTPRRRRRGRCEAPEHWVAVGGAHEGRAQCAKQAVVSPMKQGVPQASLRASEAAKRLEPRGHGAKRSPQGRNTAQALAQGGAKVWDDHAELRGAWTRNTPRRKIPFSRAKIVSLQFPRPKIRRILAETGRGRTKAAACGGNRP